MKTFICLSVSFLVLTGFSAVAQAGPGEDAAAVVVAFNQAITAGDQAAAIAQLAPGGVQYTLRALHEGINPDALVKPITEHWSMILPVIFASTENYSRGVEIVSSESHGDIATVWVRTESVSVRKGKSEASENAFTEIYMLVNSPDGWKIAGIADNRQATKIEE